MTNFPGSRILPGQNLRFAEAGRSPIDAEGKLLYNVKTGRGSLTGSTDCQRRKINVPRESGKNVVTEKICSVRKEPP